MYVVWQAAPVVWELKLGEAGRQEDGLAVHVDDSRCLVSTHQGAGSVSAYLAVGELEGGGGGGEGGEI